MKTIMLQTGIMVFVLNLIWEYHRQYLTIDATNSLVNSLVTSRIDYCNSLLNGIPKTTLNKLTARLITRTSHRIHITPVLKDLHWLPIQYRIQFKRLVLVYKALQGQSPVYIRKLLQVYTPTRKLAITEQCNCACGAEKL